MAPPLNVEHYRQKLLQMERTLLKEIQEAVPWTRYCLEHQEAFEKSSLQKTPTL